MIEGLNFRLAPLNDNDIITLNIGGEIFSTRPEILTRIPKSQLPIIVSSNQWCDTDANGYLFLDFDPKLFRYLPTQL